MSTIIATLICKNEKNNIHQWLKNVRPYVDKIVAVDNMSDDGTAEILKDHPDVLTVYRTREINEGIKRNLATKIAKTYNADWCLWLDADEWFEEGSVDKFFQLPLENRSIGAINFRLANFWKNKKEFRIDKNWGHPFKYGLPKLFRPTILNPWVNRKVSPGIPNYEGKTYYSDIRIKHFGYANPETVAKKYDYYKQVSPNEDFEHFKDEGKIIKKWENKEKTPIVILTHDNYMGLLRCIESIRKNTDNYQIIVISNNATDEIKMHIKKQDDILVEENKHNLPYTIAYNKIFKKMNTDFVVMNDDVRVTKGWLENMKEKSGLAGIVGILSDSPDQPWQNSIKNWDRKMVSFYCALIRHDVISKIGLLDEKMEWWGSDDDYCYRALQAGLGVDMADVVIHHDHSVSVNKMSNKNEIRKRNVQTLKDKWESKKICISILNQGNVRVELMNSVLKEFFRKQRHQIKINYSNLKPISHNRNSIVKRFLDVDSDYLVMIDDDIIPPDNFLDIIDLDKDVICYPCPQWHENNFYWVVMDKVKGGYKPVIVDKRKGLQEVDAIGSGFIVIKKEVLEKIKKPFERKWDQYGRQELGLDFYFCEKVKEAGFKVWCDWSKHCEHYPARIGLTKLIKLIN